MPSVVSIFGVEPFRIGGAETFARELSLQLGERGWRSVLCFQTEPPAEVRRFLQLPNVTIEIFDFRINPTLQAVRTLPRLLRTHRPDVLHLHFTGFLSLFPWLSRCLSVDQVFFTDHSSRPAAYVPGRAPFWKRKLARLINEPLDRVVCVSNYGYECMTALDLLPADRFGVVYNGVDLSRMSPDPRRAASFRRKYQIPDDRTIVAQVSWIIPEKGIADMLEAARLVISARPDVQFVFIGTGPYQEQYKKEAAALGLNGNVTWTGLIEDPFAAGVYEAADIVCQASRWEELFGWAIAEAMAFGKPVVATRVGGIPELVKDEESGFLVERGDTRGLGEKISVLLADPDLRERMGRAGQQAVKAKFDLKRNVAQLLDLYGVGGPAAHAADSGSTRLATIPL